jgi:ATP-binding cassette subfamily B protein
MNAQIIDNGVVKGDINYIYTQGAIMVGIAALQLVLSILATYFGNKSAYSVGRDLRHDVFKKVQKYSAREVSHFGAATLITRTTNDVQQVQMFVMFLLTMIISSPIMFIDGIVMAMTQDVPLSGVIAATFPVIVIVMVIFVRFTMPFFRKFQKMTDRINGILREQITGIRVVRAFVREGSEESRFSKTNAKLFNLNINTGRAMTLLFPIFMFIINVAVLGVMWFGGLRVDNGDMQIGAITAFISYMMYIMMAVLMSSMVFVMYPRAAVAAGRINKVMKTDSSVQEPESPKQIDNPKGVLEFKNVEFQYEGAEQPVLKGVSFKAEPGKTTAIIGSTGCGKSTLLRLIPRLADPTNGEVDIDGANIKDVSLKFLTDNVAVIPQKSFLFSGTVRDNMKFGKENASDEEMIEALKVAQSWNFLVEKLADDASENKLENPLDLPVSQGGTNFSGGQRQRLAIARALVKKALIYQFDDSFSALDYQTDHNLREALKPWTVNSTVIIVAQRVSTIRRADQILVMDEGKIVGCGTHDELLDNCSTYQEIVDSQLSAEEARK